MQELVAHVAALAPCTALAMPNGRTAYAREAKERGVERQDEVIAYEARLNRRGQRHRNEQDPEEAARDAAQGVRSNEFTDSEDDASSGAASDASDDEDYVAASTSRALVCTAPHRPRGGRGRRRTDPVGGRGRRRADPVGGRGLLVSLQVGAVRRGIVCAAVRRLV